MNNCEVCDRSYSLGCSWRNICKNCLYFDLGNPTYIICKTCQLVFNSCNWKYKICSSCVKFPVN